MILLLGLMVFLWVGTAQCLEEDEGFTFEGEIRHLAVATNTVYISTDEKLYQLSHDLRLVRSLIQRGTLKDGYQPGEKEFHRVSDTNALNANLSINLLLPFVKNDTLVTCGATNNSCGYCEVLDLRNISNLVYSENIQMGPLKRSNASISFLVDVKENSGRTETYILTAIEKRKDESKEIKCASSIETINLHNVNDRQDGGIFSIVGGSETVVIKREGNVEFVDGFQINSTVYLLSNVRSRDQNNKVHLSWLVSQTSKVDTLKSLRGVYLSVSDGGEGSRLLASSVISDGQPVLWSGVFSVDGGQANTEQVVFDISPDPSISATMYPDFYNPDRYTQPKTLGPKSVLLRLRHMTSVLAVRQRAWAVFFIGTQDGRLIKFVVDRNYNHACPEVLYRASDDRKVFPKIHLDPVDHKHVYVPFRNQMKRVSVSKCSMYTTLQKCWSAQDPYCVWCGSKRSCMFEDECPDSNWLSIPDESQQKIVSHKLVKDQTGQINLIIQIHVTVATTGLSNFACQFSTTSEEPCRENNPPPAFPQCTCILSDDTLPADGQSLQQHRSPEIFSITPSVVSYHGRNHALLSGCHLHDVTRVRIQMSSSCVLQESPIWNNTGVNLTFHIPSTDLEAVVKVCLLLPDGNCHGNSEITYWSSPLCTKTVPKSTWISGRRKMTLMGSHLESVEGVIHSHAPQQVRPPINSSSQTLTYESPAAGTGVSDISVFLRVANQTLVCSTKLTYYPDPEFTSFKSVREGDVVYITTQKRADKLEVTAAELSVWGVQDEKQYPCIIKDTESTYTPNFFICEIQNTTVDQFEHLMKKYGDKTVMLGPPALLHQVLMIVRLLLVPFVTADILALTFLWSQSCQTSNLELSSCVF
ncbi:plexin-C1-like [Cololabis saira]|uniref:plexin-C1-like n=1 Tax=Cololabis saira TaxID=129043 RepID=UPI002AD281E6|nr:plexin-C1-like [Cololabis saira]